MFLANHGNESQGHSARHKDRLATNFRNIPSRGRNIYPFRATVEARWRNLNDETPRLLAFPNAYTGQPRSEGASARRRCVHAKGDKSRQRDARPTKQSDIIIIIAYQKKNRKMKARKDERAKTSHTRFEAINANARYAATSGAQQTIRQNINKKKKKILAPF